MVEFAFATIVFFLILFGILEFSRALWTWNTIVQATRAGARYAVVESPVVADVKNVVVYYNPAGTGSPVLPGLTTANVVVTFQKNFGVDVTATPFTADVVRVEISNYNFNFMIPLFGSSIPLPSFATTLPVEGLGVIPP
jgi:Flp pilus assembly protein TadG